MRKEIIFTLENCYRDNMDVSGFHFGKGEKAACIVGAILAGNEVQQLYICSQLVKALKELEEKGAIVHDNKILVIPSVNHSSMNIGKRFWATDNTDINPDVFRDIMPEKLPSGSQMVCSGQSRDTITAFSLPAFTFQEILCRMSA